MLRRLFIDCETSPNIGTFWSAGYDQQIDYDNIIKERAIICICYKWEGEKAVYSFEWDKDQLDKEIISAVTDILDEADEIVMHNGDKFDLPWIRTRALFWGLPMMPNYKTIDTLKISRSAFRFNSNRLDYLGKYLGVGKKIKTDYNLWKDVVLKNDRKALAYMIKYCKMDVVLLEKVYQAMKNHIKPKTNYGVMKMGDKRRCPECASNEVIISKNYTSAVGTKSIQFKCKNCGKYHSRTIGKKEELLFTYNVVKDTIKRKTKHKPNVKSSKVSKVRSRPKRKKRT